MSLLVYGDGRREEVDCVATYYVSRIDDAGHERWFRRVDAISSTDWNEAGDGPALQLVYVELPEPPFDTSRETRAVVEIT